MAGESYPPYLVSFTKALTDFRDNIMPHKTDESIFFGESFPLYRDPSIPLPTQKEEPMINYKYSEDTSLEQIKKYIDSTYSEHYSTGNIQAAEYIVDQQQSLDYLLGNVIKYASRFGKKEGHNKKDLLKTIHYAIIALYYFEKFFSEEKSYYGDETNESV